jgi:hypothetical protein
LYRDRAFSEVGGLFESSLRHRPDWVEPKVQSRERRRRAHGLGQCRGTSRPDVIVSKADYLQTLVSAFE